MTTSVTILNNGPLPIRVSVIEKEGDVLPATTPPIYPGQFITEKFVWAGRSLKIEEVK